MENKVFLYKKTKDRCYRHSSLFAEILIISGKIGEEDFSSLVVCDKCKRNLEKSGIIFKPVYKSSDENLRLPSVILPFAGKGKKNWTGFGKENKEEKISKMEISYVFAWDDPEEKTLITFKTSLATYKDVFLVKYSGDEFIFTRLGEPLFKLRGGKIIHYYS